MIGRIYKIYNDVNSKLYIGKTLDTLDNRFKTHINDSKNNTKNKRPLYNAMNKYGYDKFHIELIEECDIQDLSIREIYWIEYFNTYKDGYNATRGGDGMQLYDYNLIVDLYYQGLTAKEIKELLNCDSYVVTLALRSANIDSRANFAGRRSKKIQAFDKKGNLLYSFNSESEAARFLMTQKITTATEERGVVTTISRAANGKRKTAFKMIWRFVE